MLCEQLYKTQNYNNIHCNTKDKSRNYLEFKNNETSNIFKYLIIDMQ